MKGLAVGILIVSLIDVTSVRLSAQLSVNSTLTAQQLVDEVLLGPGVVAFNIQYTGHAQAIGYFNGTNSNIGLDSGIILTSGIIAGAVGPNNSTQFTGINLTPGNSILDSIAQQPTLDAAVLEFDFIPSSDTVKFRYVFASEEYYEGVCTPYNDIFAFLISGPSIAGVQNIALIPNTNLPVTISSVNEGIIGQAIYSPDSTYPWCHLNYTPYYLDNTSPPGTSVQYDGFTVVLTALAAVVPCQTYHIRLAIADGGNDDTWDSGVFIEAGSFNSHYISITGNPILRGATVDSAGMEGCASIELVFRRYDSISSPRTLAYTISGTAVNGVDYTLSATNIYFAPGEDSCQLIITPILDALTESMEDVKIQLVPDFIVCNGWDTASVTIYIVDSPPISVYITEDLGDCLLGSLTATAHASGGALGSNFIYNWSPSGGSDSTEWIPFTPMTYTVTVTDSCGTQSAQMIYVPTDTCDFYLPNIITPDGNGINDFFVIPDEYITSGTRLEIFNRWGNIIFLSQRYDNNWNADGIVDGTYYYHATFFNGRTKTGFFSIVRK